MKKIGFAFVMLALIVSIGCSQEDSGNSAQPTLTSQEISDLLFMYEEEKMARDLYLIGKEKYGGNQFTNISSSEQRHMDAIAEILEAHSIPLPVEDIRGEFTDEVIIELFNSLEQLVLKSEIDAYRAAALVEETDIADLREAIKNTTNEDILNVYTHLVCGSGNHIRAFTKKLDMLGVTYEPTVLSNEEYDEIIASGHASCGD